MSGQERVKKILRGALKFKRIPNAYLFYGPPGAGKEETAKFFAQALNCVRNLEEACGECASCAKALKGVHPDILTIEPQGATIKIEQIRELKTLTRYGPSEGKWLVCILKEADRCTPEAANSFLKLLEEPPAGVVFILLTSRVDALPPTIRSRCQKVLFTETFKGEELELDLKQKGIVELLDVAKNLSQDEKIEQTLESILGYYGRGLKSEGVKYIKAVMEALKDIKKRANVRLTLDVMCLKLGGKIHD